MAASAAQGPDWRACAVAPVTPIGLPGRSPRASVFGARLLTLPVLGALHSPSAKPLWAASGPEVPPAEGKRPQGACCASTTSGSGPASEASPSGSGSAPLRLAAPPPPPLATPPPAAPWRPRASGSPQRPAEPEPARAGQQRAAASPSSGAVGRKRSLPQQQWGGADGQQQQQRQRQPQGPWPLQAAASEVADGAGTPDSQQSAAPPARGPFSAGSGRPAGASLPQRWQPPSGSESAPLTPLRPRGDLQRARSARGEGGQCSPQAAAATPEPRQGARGAGAAGGSSSPASGGWGGRATRESSGGWPEELEELEGAGNGDAGGEGGAEREEGESKRPRLSARQTEFLEGEFQQFGRLDNKRKAWLAWRLGVRPRQVAVWFQNRRVRWRAKQQEEELEGARGALASLQCQFNSLQAEYEALLGERHSLERRVTELTGRTQHAHSGAGAAEGCGPALGAASAFPPAPPPPAGGLFFCDDSGGALEPGQRSPLRQLLAGLAGDAPASLLAATEAGPEALLGSSGSGSGSSSGGSMLVDGGRGLGWLDALPLHEWGPLAGGRAAAAIHPDEWLLLPAAVPGQEPALGSLAGCHCSPPRFSFDNFALLGEGEGPAAAALLLPPLVLPPAAADLSASGLSGTPPTGAGGAAAHGAPSGAGGLPSARDADTRQGETRPVSPTSASPGASGSSRPLAPRPSLLLDLQTPGGLGEAAGGQQLPTTLSLSPSAEADAASNASGGEARSPASVGGGARDHSCPSSAAAPDRGLTWSLLTEEAHSQQQQQQQQPLGLEPAGRRRQLLAVDLGPLAPLREGGGRQQSEEFPVALFGVAGASASGSPFGV